MNDRLTLTHLITSGEVNRPAGALSSAWRHKALVFAIGPCSPAGG
jgi:hypothetical protein